MRTIIRLLRRRWFIAALHTLLEHGKQREATDPRDRIIAPLTLALVFAKKFGLERALNDGLSLPERLDKASQGCIISSNLLFTVDISSFTINVPVQLAILTTFALYSEIVRINRARLVLNIRIEVYDV